MSNRYTGTFVAKTSTGFQSITGLGFKPTIVMITGVIEGTADTDTTGEAYRGWGLSDGTTEKGYYQKDFGTKYWWLDDDIIYLNNTAGSSTATHRANINTMDSDGFTLNWVTTNSDTMTFSYVAFDFADAKILTDLENNTSTGTKAYTGAGFQPNLLFCFSYLGGSKTGAGTGGVPGFGVAHSSGEWFSGANNEDTNFVSGSCIGGTSSGGTTVFELANLDSFDSDGFTLNWTVAFSNPRYFAVIAVFSDENLDVGVYTQPTSDGTDAVTGVGFAPEALLMLESNDTNSGNTGIADETYSLGFYDGTRHTAAGRKAIVGSGSTKRNWIETDLILRLADSGTVSIGDASVSSLDSDGFTLNWSNTNGTAYQIGYVAFGDTVIFNRSATTVLGLSQDLDSNIKLKSVETDTALIQALDSNIKLESITEQINAIQTIVKQVLTTEEVEHVLALVDQVGQTYSESVTTVLSLAQEAFRKMLVEQSLGLTSSVTGIGVTFASNVMALAHAASQNKDAYRTVLENLTLSQGLLWEKDVANLACLYYPFVGADGIDPTPPTLGTATLTLEFGATTLVLKNPLFDNSDQLGFQRIRRSSRGGTRILFADPNWPKTQTQRFTITNLNDTQRDELITFVDDTIGKIITLTDHHNRQWSGFITTPDLDISQQGECQHSVSFEFEGTLV